MPPGGEWGKATGGTEDQKVPGTEQWTLRHRTGQDRDGLGKDQQLAGGRSVLGIP